MKKITRNGKIYTGHYQEYYPDEKLRVLYLECKCGDRIKVTFDRNPPLIKETGYLPVEID